jgi:putative endonuclease
MWFVYLIRTKKGIYTGVTNDLLRRYSQHKGIIPGGAKFFRGNKPIELSYLETHPNRSLAQKRESQIKKFTKAQKEDLIQLIAIKIKH